MTTAATRARTAAITTFVACVLCLICAPAASAAFGLTNLTATPADTNAGANSDFSIGLDVTDPASDLKDLTIHLPPGLVGNPLATTTCTEEELAADACPPESDVGDVTNDVTLTVLGFIPVDQSVNGNLYNVVPRQGEPARFGIVLNALPFNVPILGPAILPPIILQSAANLRPSDLGLDTVLTDLPNTATVAGMDTEIDIRGVGLTLSGQVGTPPKGFLRNPTSCKTHTVGFDAVAYDGQIATGSTTFDTVNCGALPFTPEFSANVKVGKAGEAVEVATTISQTIEEAGLSSAVVTLPKDIFGSGALGRACSDADFQAGTCPANTVVGTAVAASPLQSQALTGPVVLVGAGGGLPEIGLDLRGALGLKLKGAVALTADGRNVVTFNGLPDIPISEFTLTFAGGPGGVNFATRDICQPPVPIFDAAFTSFSGATAQLAVPAKVDCSGATGGGGTQTTKPPKARVKLSSGGSEEPRVAISVKKGTEKLKSVEVALPKALRFGSKKAFEEGASIRGGKKVKDKHTRRKLTLTAKKTVDKFVAKIGGGALRSDGGLQSKPPFKLSVVDATGKRTKLVVRPK